LPPDYPQSLPDIHVQYQPQHTTQLDSIIKIPAGKDNLRRDNLDQPGFRRGRKPGIWLLGSIGDLVERGTQRDLPRQCSLSLLV
jgi:hypothetical protein